MALAPPLLCTPAPLHPCSLPLPLRPAAWALRLARPWVPQLKDTAVDELILSLAEADVEEETLKDTKESEKS